MHSQLIQVLIYLTAAAITVPLFRFFGLGAILAYLFSGIMIGPQVMTLIDDPKTILHFSELGVVFLLFLIGLELHPSRLWRMRYKVFGLGLAQMLVTGLLLYFILLSVGLTQGASFVAGFGLALSSTAFGLQLLEETRQLKTLHGQGSFSILLFQDLAVVPLIALVPIIAGTKDSSSTSFEQLLVSAGIIGLFFVVGIFLVRHFFRYIARSGVQEIFTGTSLLIVIGSAVLMEAVGLSMGTGAFLAGVLLANSEYRHELEINLQPFKGLLLGLFFMAVGMSLDLGVLVSSPLYIALTVASFMLIKAIVILALGRLFGFPNESARNMAFTLPQGGEFAFVLFSAAFANGIFNSNTNSILNASVTISMALTPFLFKFNQRYLRTFSEVSERPYDSISSEQSDVIIAGFGRFGQIVARFLLTQNISFTVLEHSSDQVETARKFGTKIFYGDASRADVIESAGAKDAKIFVLAIDDPESSVKTAKMVREKFPHLKIVARVRNRQHAIELFQLGIENVHRETYLTSLEVAKDVLLQMGHRREQINKKLAVFRKHDEGVLRKQMALWEDEKALISFNKQANLELAEILKADLESDQIPHSVHKYKIEY